MRIWINGELTPPDQAKVSVFDSGSVLGDGVWEGLRVVDGLRTFFEAHFDRLAEGAGQRGAMRTRLQDLYADLIRRDLADGTAPGA